MNDFAKTIKELERQRDSIDAAIKALHSLGGGGGANRRRGSRNMSPEGRARIAAGQRRRWAKLKAAKKK